MRKTIGSIILSIANVFAWLASKASGLEARNLGDLHKPANKKIVLDVEVNTAQFDAAVEGMKSKLSEIKVELASTKKAPSKEKLERKAKIAELKADRVRKLEQALARAPRGAQMRGFAIVAEGNKLPDMVELTSVEQAQALIADVKAGKKNLFF